MRGAKDTKQDFNIKIPYNFEGKATPQNRYSATLPVFFRMISLDRKVLAQFLTNKKEIRGKSAI